MAMLPKYDFSAESAVKDSLFARMCAVYDSQLSAGVAAKKAEKEAVSFDEISGEVFGRPQSGVNKPTPPAKDEKTKTNGGRQIN